MSSIARTFAGSAIATQQRRLVDEGDRHRLVALGGGGGDEVRRGHVDLEDRQVQVVEPVALGDRAGELPPASARRRCEQHLARAWRPSVARRLDRRVDALARSASPRSTMTSVRKRLEPPRRLGRVMPFQGSVGRDRHAPSASVTSRGPWLDCGDRRCRCRGRQSTGS